MNRFTKLVAATAVLPVVAFAGVAHADVQSSIEGGDIYRVKNITKNTDFADPASADACDVLQYKVRIHNPGPNATLKDVTVQAVFGTAATTHNVSTATVRASNASPSSTTDTATVNLSTSQTLSYVNGTTQLLDANGNVISILPDTITGAGVNIGSVGVSLANKRYVQFEEKVSCPTTPPPVTPPTTTPSAKVIPNTGAGDVAELFVGTSAFGAIGHFIFGRRKRL